MVGPTWSDNAMLEVSASGLAVVGFFGHGVLECCGLLGGGRSTRIGSGLGMGRIEFWCGVAAWRWGIMRGGGGGGCTGVEGRGKMGVGSEGRESKDKRKRCAAKMKWLKSRRGRAIGRSCLLW